MNNKIGGILWIVLCMSFQLYSQVDITTIKDVVLIGPRNVDVQYQVQQDYYINKYKKLEKGIQDDLLKFNGFLKELEEKDKLKKNDRAKKIQYTRFVKVLNQKLKSVVEFRTRWENLKLDRLNDEFYNQFDTNVCYDLNFKSGIMSLEETVIVCPDTEIARWNEFFNFDAIVLSKISVEYEDDIALPFPTELLPSKTIISKPKATCPAGFTQVEGQCIKKIKTELNEDAALKEAKIKFLNIYTLQEMKLVDWNVIPCQ